MTDQFLNNQSANNQPTALLLLYSTSACHLCELAEELLATVLAEPGLLVTEADRVIDFVKIDIAEDDALLERYGVRIPVLCDPLGGRELGWPFDAEMLIDYLDSLNETVGSNT